MAKFQPAKVQAPEAGRKSYVPALGFHRLSGLYDPMIERWGAAKRMRDCLVEALDLKPGMKILELGSGPGRLAIQIKRDHPGVSIDAIDVDPQMIRRAQKNAQAAGADIRFLQGCVTALPNVGSFDRIYSTMVFHHLAPAQKQRALMVARALLRPGGSFVVADFGRPRGHLQWALFSFIQQPLDGYRNTAPHRDGRYERALRSNFGQVRSEAVWRTVAGTLEMFVCSV